MMNLNHALRVDANSRVAFVGAGGKTSAIFQCAREIGKKVIVITTTHIFLKQAQLADHHYILRSVEDLRNLETDDSVLCLSGEPGEDERVGGLPDDVLSVLPEWAANNHYAILIEADGSRGYPLKAPAVHEPVIPDWVDTVVVCAGLQALGKPLAEPVVHRPVLFSSISGLLEGETITTEAIVQVLIHPQGGLKGIKPTMRKVVFLNQADTDELRSIGGQMADELVKWYDSVLVGSLEHPSVWGSVDALYEPVAAIILAAGESKRFGQPKQLFQWKGKPFVRQVVEIALSAGLHPVVVVLGAYSEKIHPVLEGLSIQVVINKEWQEGQGSSIRNGMHVIPASSGAVIFFQVDKPQVTPELIRNMVEFHRRSKPEILAPVVEDQRTTPVLFDRKTFAALHKLQGEAGGKVLFSKFQMKYLPWHDGRLLIDIDTIEDYRTLMAGEE